LDSICILFLKPTQAALLLSYQVNDRINLKVDAQTQVVVDTVQKYMQQQIIKVKN